MKKKLLTLGTILVLLILSVGGCNSGSKNSSNSIAGNEAIDYGEAAIENYAMQEEVDGVMGSENEASSIADNPDTTVSDGRKLIQSKSLGVETLEFDELIEHIKSIVNEMGGYVESSNIQGNSYGTDELRSAYLTVRVPADQMAAFAKDIEDSGNVIYKTGNEKDVTLAYTDVETHKAALQVEYDRLLEIMEAAETVEDIITIESRLSEVRYQMESYESQTRVYDNLIEYSTIELNIIEVEQETPLVERGVVETIKEGFSNSISNIGLGLKNIFVNFIIYIPYLVIIAVIALIVYFIIRKKRWGANNDKK